MHARTLTKGRFVAPVGLWVLVALNGCRGESLPGDADIAASAPPPPAAVASRFSVSLDYDFTPVLRVVERVVPLTFGSMDSIRMIGTDSRRQYAFAANRSAFTAFADGRLVHLKATLEYSARGFFDPPIGPRVSLGCGKGADRPRIVAELATPLSLTSRWRLSSRAQLLQLAPASTEKRDQCDVSLLRFDVTDQVMVAARRGIAARLPDIDRRIGEVDLRPRFARLWTHLEQPLRLTDGVWLKIVPEQLLMGKVSGTGHILTVPVTLVAHPVIVTSPATPPVSARPLPALGRDTASGGFRISLDGVVDYAAASSAITAALTGKQITEGGHTLTPGAIVVRPASRGRLSVAVAFTGDAAGTLRLLGTPAFDRVRREITVPDLDYDLDSDSKLINTYSWLRSDALRSTLREKAHVPVDAALDKGRQLLLSGLNRTIGDALTLAATVDSVAVQELFVTRAGLVVRAIATGQAKVSVHQR